MSQPIALSVQVLMRSSLDKAFIPGTLLPTPSYSRIRKLIYWPLAMQQLLNERGFARHFIAIITVMHSRVRPSLCGVCEIMITFHSKLSHPCDTWVCDTVPHIRSLVKYVQAKVTKWQLFGALLWGNFCRTLFAIKLHTFWSTVQSIERFSRYVYGRDKKNWITISIRQIRQPSKRLN